jgi:hypothetical protein
MNEKIQGPGGARITPDMAGPWLDGNQGWHNHYRVVDIAQSYGWKGLDEWADGERTVARYRTNEWTDNDHESMLGQGGIVDEATEYLETLAPDGHHFEWSMGELSLLPCESIEGHDPSDCWSNS